MMTQYAYLTPTGSLIAISFDGPPPLTLMHRVDDQDTSDTEVVISGPRQYLDLLETDLESLIAGLIVVAQRWVPGRSEIQRALGAALGHLSIGAPDLAQTDLRGVLAAVDVAVRNNPPKDMSSEHASRAFVANLVAVLLHF